MAREDKAGSGMGIVDMLFLLLQSFVLKSRLLRERPFTASRA
jgi:hypothetical protein